VADYLALAKLYGKVSSKKQETIETYRAVLKLDAANAEARQRLAELAPGEPVTAAEPAQAESKTAPSARPETTAPAATVPGGSPASAKSTADWTRQDWINESVKQMAAGQFTEAENGLMEALSKEPGDPEVCRLLASLHLKRGELAGAKAEFRFLAEAALRALDFQLAQSMLGEYLEADPACVELRELLGRAYEQSGDAATAVTQYGQGLETLLKHHDPELPSLPEELYAKIVELAPASPLVKQFAGAFSRQPEAKPAAAVPPPEPVRPAVALPRPPVEAEKPKPAQPAGKPAFKFAASAPDPESVAQEPETPQEPAAVADSSEEELTVAQAPVEVEPAAEPAAAEAQASGAEETPEQSAWEQPVEPDYSAHYELGVAYRNMGLQEEAIEEFHVATGGTDCFLDACRMLAACLTDRNQNRPAIEYLEQALADPRCKGAEADLIRYELGLLYEAEGMDGSALQVYSQIPSFRDVPRRLERITGSTEPVPSTVGGPSASGDSPAAGRKKRKISYL
jgi:tetratricopeptide (TPR) repeat protein